MIWSDPISRSLVWSPWKWAPANIHYAVEIPSCGFQGIFHPKRTILSLVVLLYAHPRVNAARVMTELGPDIVTKKRERAFLKP